MIDREPYLQHKYGRKGKYAQAMTRENYTDYGYFEKVNVEPYEWDYPWYCGDTDLHECDCNGVLYRSYLNDPITSKRIESFEEIRHWKFQTV